MLEKLIKINSVYARSINLERDSSKLDLIDSYIPTSVALQTIKKVADTFDGSRQQNRSWTLVGPYGSGKSSFGLFLSGLLSDPKSEEFSICYKKLAKVDQKTAHKVLNYNKGTKGYIKVLISGSNESLKNKLAEIIFQKIDCFSLNSQDSKSYLDLKEKYQSDNFRQSDILSLITLLDKMAKSLSFSGVLLVFDELGKFIEYEVSQRENNDLHVLQMIAEYSRSPKTNLVFFGLLHQSFQHYSKSLSESLKNEWTKIQGRFEEIPFIDSTEQTLKVLSQCFTNNQTFNDKDLNGKYKNFSVSLRQHFLSIEKNSIHQLLMDCYPLHPVSCMMLPILSQKIAQNERTVFSFITSSQVNSFSYWLKKLKFGEFIKPHHIYDYFISNQITLISDSMTNRRWVEVSEAINRLEDEFYLPLLKTIGVINIITGTSSIKASREILTLCDFDNLDKQLEYLEKKSIIKFRKYSNDYRIWEGSDFDLESELTKEKSKILNFSLIDEIYSNFEISPIVARKFSIDNSLIKTFDIKFVDMKSYEKIYGFSEPQIIFFISYGSEDENFFYKHLKKLYNGPYIISLLKGSDSLQELLKEKLSLKGISKKKELTIDRVAKREFEDYNANITKQLNNIFFNIYNNPQNFDWFYNNKKVSVLNKFQFQKKLSFILEDIYPDIPVIKNELINRDELSSQGTAIRNSLTKLMLKNSSEEDFGLEKHPAEKSIYYSVLKKTGIHNYNGDKWELTKPRENNLNILPVWNKIDSYFKNLSQKADFILNLIEVLKAPPFGVKAGVLPILILSYYLANKNFIAIYHKRKYEPYFSDEILERFLKRPDEFTFQYLEQSDSTKKLYKVYSSIFLKQKANPSVLDIAKPIAKLMDVLPYYTKNTETLSVETKEIRSSFYFAKTPQDFLNKELPRIFKLKLENIKKQSDLSDFERGLTNAFNDLKNCYSDLLSYFHKLILEKFLDSKDLNLKQMRTELIGRYDHLWTFTIDSEGIKNFIGKISLKHSSIDNWFLNLLMSLVHKPVDKWNDVDKENAEFKICEYAKKIIDLRTLKLANDKYEISENSDEDVLLFKLKSIRPKKDFNEEVLLIEKKDFKVVKELKEKIKTTLKTDNNLSLKALALLTQELIEQKQLTQRNKETKKKMKELQK